MGRIKSALKEEQLTKNKATGGFLLCFLLSSSEFLVLDRQISTAHCSQVSNPKIFFLILNLWRRNATFASWVFTIEYDGNRMLAPASYGPKRSWANGKSWDFAFFFLPIYWDFQSISLRKYPHLKRTLLLVLMALMTRFEGEKKKTLIILK